MGTIAVVGSINMDLMYTTERIPHSGETLRGDNLQHLPGGKGANQAVAAAKLGGRVEMFGCLGSDATGKALLENLRQCGVGTRHIRLVDDVPSGMAFITVSHGENTIVVVAGANERVDVAYIQSVQEALLQADVILLQHEIPQETNEYVIRLGHERGKRVILNPAPARPVAPALLEQLTYLTPNEHEAALIFGGDLPLEDALARHLEKLIVTMGEQGVCCGLRNGTLLQVPAMKAEVVDTTGAGDTLNGAFAHSIAQNKPLADALAYANAAASCAIEHYGAQEGMPAHEQVLARLKLAGVPASGT